MASLNRVSLIGNVGRDPEVRYTQSGEAILSFSLATTETWNKDGEKHEDTQWHNVTVFGKLAASLKDYITKGKKLFVEGKLVTEAWTDKDGNNRKTTKVKLGGYDSKIILLGGKGENAPRSNSAPAPGPVSTDDDVPF
jgi:single-strand DNA-binding protein